MDKVDYKKKQKELYFPGGTPSIVTVPEMIFIAVDGKGDPNVSEEYKQAVQLLYGLSYTIKMNKSGPACPDGYFEYVVPPLEGFWWSDDEQFATNTQINKELFLWTSVIRQPEFVTTEAFEQAKTILKKKKPELSCSDAKLIKYTEGLCVQIMHYGSYDEEASTIQKMEAFLSKTEYQVDLSETRRHHEIYLSDPRRTSTERLKTIIRYPITYKNDKK
ncbi:MAG: GyrI-like domain-containing protein [bacterium]|nr:GyrI-like domain-containing protein [bacterium]